MKWFLMFLTAITALQAAPRELQIRAYLHQPQAKSEVVLQILASRGEKVAIAWRREDWSERFITKIEGSELLFVDQAGAPAARATVPENTNQILVLLAPDSSAQAKLPFRALVLDAAATAFPWGTSIVVSMLAKEEVAIEAGEHRLSIPAGKITKVPMVTKRDDFNMAQVNFYTREEEQWAPFTERRLQFVDDLRRVFIVFPSPGSAQPFVTTLIDHQPRREPGT